MRAQEGTRQSRACLDERVVDAAPPQRVEQREQRHMAVGERQAQQFGMGGVGGRARLFSLKTAAVGGVRSWLSMMTRSGWRAGRSVG